MLDCIQGCIDVIVCNCIYNNKINPKSLSHVGVLYSTQYSRSIVKHFVGIVSRIPDAGMPLSGLNKNN